MIYVSIGFCMFILIESQPFHTKEYLSMPKWFTLGFCILLWPIIVGLNLMDMKK